MLRKVVLGRIRCEPFDDGARRGYRFRGAWTYG
jgi:hypothetical protein